MAKLAQSKADKEVKADLDIVRPFYSADKAFKSKGWPDKEFGYGVSMPKLNSIDKKGVSHITIRLDRKDVFTVGVDDLKRKIQTRGCFNTNGRVECGYCTKSDLYTLSRGLKSASKTLEDTSQARA